MVHRTQPVPPYPVYSQELPNDWSIQTLVPIHDPESLKTPLHDLLVVDADGNDLVFLCFFFRLFQLEGRNDGRAVARLWNDHHLEVDCVPRENHFWMGKAGAMS